MTDYNINITNGQATLNLDTTNYTPGTYNITIEYPTNNTYNQATTTSTLTLTQNTNPYRHILNQSYYTCMNNTFTSSATSSISNPSDTQILFNNRNSYIYTGATLQDFIDYTDGDVNFILKKSGGDGRYNLGFVNPDTQDTLGYIDITAHYIQNTLAGEQVTFSDEMYYNHWCECLFHFDTTDNTLTVYWYGRTGSGSDNYQSASIGLGDIDPSEYYLYLRPYNRELYLTRDTSLIEYPALDPNGGGESD